MFLQLPTPTPSQLDNWLSPAAAILSIFALLKKVMPPKRNDDSFATKAELNHELGIVRDKIDARFLSLTEKLESVGGTIHDRLAKLESAVARLDERTK